MSEVQWFYDQNGLPGGPVSASELSAMVEQKKLSPDVLVWQEGEQQGVPFNQSTLSSTMESGAAGVVDSSASSHKQVIKAPHEYFVWAAAICPLVNEIQRFFLFGPRLAYVAIGFAISVLMYSASIADWFMVRKRTTVRINFLMCLFPPVYLTVRGMAVKGDATAGMFCLLSLLVIYGLHKFLIFP